MIEELTKLSLALGIQELKDWRIEKFMNLP
jgi:hypothetical protein